MARRPWRFVCWPSQLNTCYAALYEEMLWRSSAERDEEVFCGGNVVRCVLTLVEADTLYGYRVYQMRVICKYWQMVLL